MNIFKELLYFIAEALLLIAKIILGGVAFIFVGIGMFVMYLKARADARRDNNHWKIK